ncbi:molecular chaperone HscC [Pectobacterium parmentieri]|nr:molecular chaperone HscC [Pectobacterium parmentieri]AYH26895.1 molecular chaperone HscC [Pectobacterium parmentieri]AYH31344.1 molecular chaperone HscC [Pectobacterium parmentieri]MBI0517617.1 molecular chaperone HscC [Pectobacterium parmentieri]RKO79399.1 molecular chaperone HscC [Pectobacterium parmentieri]
MATMHVMGIDLGTTNSAVSLWQNGKSVLIPNQWGEVLTPSVVGLDEQGNILIGRPARARLQRFPQLTQASFKRYMGTDVILSLGTRQFRAEELSALLLRQLKQDAETWLGQPLTRAVITVPAYFNDVQRRAVKNAARLAGLEVARLLNEPTAASLAFGLLENREQKYLTFDLGGGTFDVSIIDMFEGVVEVRASSGDVQLGGDDFSEAIVQWMLRQHPELRESSPVLRAELLARADAMKQTLSLEDNAAATIEWNGRQWHWTLTETALTDCCQTLLTRLQRPIQQALHDARFSLYDLDHILLVGGATRMRLVRQTVARLFGRFPRYDLNPDEAVALGAGVQAGMVMNDSAVEDIILTDVMPFSLGVEVAKRHAGQIESGFFLPLIERNTFLPVSKMETVNTVENNQTMVLLKIYQGEGRRVQDNVFLGEMQVEVPPRPAGEIELDVRFTYTLDGLLEVECCNKDSPTVSRLVIEKIPGQMSEEQIAASLQKLIDLKLHPRARQENQVLLARCSRLYEHLLGEERRWIDELLTAFEQALESQDVRCIATMRGRVEQFLRQYDEELPS